MNLGEDGIPLPPLFVPCERLCGMQTGDVQSVTGMSSHRRGFLLPFNPVRDAPFQYKQCSTVRLAEPASPLRLFTRGRRLFDVQPVSSLSDRCVRPCATLSRRARKRGPVFIQLTKIADNFLEWSSEEEDRRKCELRCRPRTARIRRRRCL